MDNPFNELAGSVQQPETAPAQTTIFDNPPPAEAAPTQVPPTEAVPAPFTPPTEAVPAPFTPPADPVPAPFTPPADPAQAAPAPFTPPAAPAQAAQAPFTPPAASAPQQPVQQPVQQTQGGVNMQNQQGGQPQFGQNTPTFGGGQQPFGGGQQQQFGGGQQQHQTPKYYIIDMLWLINQKIIKKEQLQQNDRHLLSVGINASFGNMRMTFYDTENNVFTPSSIIIANATRKTVANAYPEACSEILFNKETGKAVFLFERVIRADNRWTPNQTSITWVPNKIIIQSMDSQNNQSLFEIVDWQIIAFEKVLTFMTTGGSWMANLQGTINR